jgi:hypothetical protein
MSLVYVWCLRKMQTTQIVPDMVTWLGFRKYVFSAYMQICVFGYMEHSKIPQTWCTHKIFYRNLDYPDVAWHGDLVLGFQICVFSVCLLPSKNLTTLVVFNVETLVGFRIYVFSIHALNVYSKDIYSNRVLYAKDIYSNRVCRVKTYIRIECVR